MDMNFLVSEEPTWCKLLQGDERVYKQTCEITVPIARLDTIISSDNLSKPDVIKIDVEGAEKDVLDGAAHILRSARPVLLIELHRTNRDIEESLSKLVYRALTLDGLDSISDARWDAYVIAVPHERDDLYPILLKVCS